MKLIIDGSNLLEGGGIVHLKNLLHFEKLNEKYSLEKVIVYGCKKLFDYLPSHDWLELRDVNNLNRSLIHRLYWQVNQLRRKILNMGIIFYLTGGLYLGKYKPFVTMYSKYANF